MKRSTSSLSISLLAAGLAAGSAHAHDDEVTAWRLFIADHSEPVVHAIDALNGESLESFAIHGPASLYRSHSGETVYAVQGSADVVTTINTGIAFHDHGDHADIEVEAPSLSGTEIEGEYPVHFVEHQGHWAAFFDKEGVARIFRERDALMGSVELREVNAGAPHHGVVVPYGNYDLVSEPHPEGPSNLPIGIRVQDRDGNQIGELAECPDLHGEAATGNLMAFACATGLLIVRSEVGGPSIEHLPYADTLPEGKATTLLGGRGLQYFMGNFLNDQGHSAVVLIDPSEEEAFRLVELPTRRVHFAVDPIRARYAYVFTEDGQLHQLDVLAGEITRSLRLTDPYSMDGHWRDPRPRVTVAGEYVFVTDPLEGKLHQVAAASFEKSGEVVVEGTPFGIVAVGGTGMVHSHD
ncbi:MULTISPECIES: zinc metallochaperone AztD [unclassified Halomonas]|uniref:zinc metallochaperone AztD n=1 Tax=unclassified Halomonas TaxID=2609666 RepID=UPI000288EAEB|nr:MULTISPECIES: zinc metallochaperone AztD [unclassified Halomonas]MCE8039558.1 metallochaperone AztD [Halomonas sp. MCCC 1A11062]